MKQLFLLTTLIFTFLLVAKINAQNDKKKLQFYGDFRFRTELDKNSIRTDGTKRDDRDRLRYRLRVGFKYALNKNFELGSRIRTGNPLNQQSPHITLDKEFQADDFLIDKAYLKEITKIGIWAWVGKNNMPFWEQNELLWDNDVNPEGITLGGTFHLNKNSNVEPVFGYFIAGHSGKNFSNDSSISIAQIKFSYKIQQNNLILSSGLINGSNIPDKPDNTGSFFINYNIWATSLQYNRSKMSTKLGIDYFKNLSDYDTNENIPNIYKHQTSGFVGSLICNLKKIQISYYYALIQKFAVIDFFAQDDWVRWGNNNFTRSSNFKGHELRLRYRISEQFNTVLRTYFVKGLKTLGTTIETGTRIRLDLNIKF